MYKKKFKIVILLETSRAYDRDILTGITNYNKLHDKFIFFFSPPYYTDKENGEKLIQRIVDWEPDGIITGKIPEIKKIEALNVPMIISPYNLPDPNHINIRGKGQELGDMVAKYFMSKGHHNFAFFGLKNFFWSSERQEGYVSCLKKSGHTSNALIYDIDVLLWEQLPELLVNWLASLKTPCAIFSANDELNVQLIEAAKEFGAKVPDDFSIIGVDNDVMICELASTALSSVEHDAVQAGFDAALAMSRWIEFGEQPVDDIIVGLGSIVTRNSTNALAIDDEYLREAMYYIANTAPYKDISVADVVNASTLSRRVLEKKFKTIIKNSILEEIKKKRIDRIKFLLVNSDFSVKEIAYELDFRSTDNITRYFKQYTGQGLLEYRNSFGKSL